MEVFAFNINNWEEAVKARGRLARRGASLVLVRLAAPNRNVVSFF